MVRPTPQRGWLLSLCAWLVALLLGGVWLDALVRNEAQSQAPGHFAGPTSLGDGALTAADLPQGWQILESRASTVFGSEGRPRAAWLVVFLDPSGRVRGSERILAFASADQARRYGELLRRRAVPR